MLPVNHQAMPFFPQLLSSLPDFLDKWAGCIVLVGIDPLFFELVLYLKRGAKSGYNNDIILRQRFDRDSLRTVRVKQKFHTSACQIFIHSRIVDHLTQQVNIPVRILFYRPVGDVNRAFYPIAKSKVTRESKMYRTESEKRRSDS